MNHEDHFEALAGHLERALAAEFPNWQIQQSESGNWTAVGLGRVVLIADTALELQSKLNACEQQLAMLRSRDSDDQGTLRSVSTT